MDHRTTIDSNNGINDLPNELLAKIFSSVTVATGWQNPRKLPSPALLSSVCSHWRIVAQKTPELWVNINVPLHKWPEDCSRWTAEWIARSGILPISVMINDTAGYSITPHLTDTMNLLSQHSDRLRYLAIHSRSSIMIERAFSTLRYAPNLQQLTIYRDDRSSSWFHAENRSQRQYSLDFPRLTILKTQGSMVSPIPNLTSLTIGRLYASYDDISQYFRASPGLQDLTLCNLLPLASSPPHAALIHADSLRSLAVKIVPWSQGLGLPIFNYLALPNVNYLELNGDGWTVPDFAQSLSFAELDTLRISDRFSLATDSIHFLHSFSTVRHLQLVHAYTHGLLPKSRRSLNRNNPRRSQAPTNLDTANSIQQNQSTSVWPKLRTITLDTLEVDDVLNLCNFVTSHKQLQVVELSTSARRHLSSSLRRKGNRVYKRPLLSASSKKGSDDVEEWLGKMVDIRTLHSPSVGLVDAN